MGKVSLKVLEKFLNCLFKIGCEPWNYFPDGLAILIERVVTVAVVCSKLRPRGLSCARLLLNSSVRQYLY